MARSKARSQTRTEIVRYQPPRQAPIVVNVPRPRAMAAPTPKKHHRRRGGGGGGKDTVFHHIAAGAALGFLDNANFAIPTLPVLGKAGTLAVICHFMKGRSPWFAAGEKTFAAIATYELVKDGSISGDIAPQVGWDYGPVPQT